MKTIRASEIGTYLFCQRAWWYERQGLESENLAELASGTQLHARHERFILTTGCMRAVAYALILAAIVFLTIYIVKQFI